MFCKKLKRQKFEREIFFPLGLFFVAGLLFITLFLVLSNIKPVVAQTVDSNRQTGETKIAIDAGENLLLNAPQNPNDKAVLRGAAMKLISAQTGRKILAVYVFDEAKKSRADLPIQGNYTINGDRLEFKPDFEFLSGISYEIVIDADNFGSPKAFSQIFKIPARSISAAPEIVKIYPSGDVLPANLLRFYIYFSEPMRRGESYKYICLKDEKGAEIPDAFVFFGQELWSADGLRLTVLFDPGRIKRGVTANLKIGSALKANHRYEILIAPGWLSEKGVPLTTYDKNFSVTEAVREPLKPKNWTINYPTAATREPLIIRFDRTLDYALLESRLKIKDSSGNVIKGEISVGENEKSWNFTPCDAWISGDYEIIVGSDLEDASGNRPGEALDHDAGDTENSGEFYGLKFTVSQEKARRNLSTNNS